MDLVSGQPFWPAQDGPLPEFPQLDRDVECDVAIVGGGITGALLAYYLTQAGCDSIVADLRRLGTGSTSASTALLEYQLETDLSSLIPMLGEDAAVRIYRLCREAVHEFERITGELEADCEFGRKIGVYIASRPKDIKTLEREAAARERFGFHVELIGREELKRRFSINARAAILQEPSAQVNPYRLTRELLLSSVRRGLRVFTRTEVQRVEASVRRSVLVTPSGARINTRRVVFAAGYEMLPHLPEGLADLRNTYALASQQVDRVPAGVDGCLFSETLRPYLYTRTTSDRRIMIGGEDDEHADPEIRAQQLPEKTRNLLEKFQRWFPDLKLEAEYAWAGAYAKTKDGIGYLDYNPTYPNVFYAIGTGGNGMVFSIVAAQILRDYCTGKKNDDLSLFRFNRRWTLKK